VAVIVKELEIEDVEVFDGLPLIDPVLVFKDNPKLLKVIKGAIEKIKPDGVPPFFPLIVGSVDAKIVPGVKEKDV
jgi:hypothetical protein